MLRFRIMADPYPGACQVHHNVRWSTFVEISGSSGSAVAAERSAVKTAFDPARVSRLAKLSLAGAKSWDLEKPTETDLDKPGSRGTISASGGVVVTSN